MIACGGRRALLARRGNPFHHLRIMFGPALAVLAMLAVTTRVAAGPVPAAPGPRIADERSGTLATHDAQQLRLTTDSGSVRIFTDALGEVRYRVRIEADSSDPAAHDLVKEYSFVARGTPAGVALTGNMPKPSDAGRVWISYEVHVPRKFNLDISTRAGDIVTQDIDGHLVLSTGGGNIQSGRAGDFTRKQAASAQEAPVAKLESAGGHILIGDVAGSLRASTGGGHITTGDVMGDAVLHTGGGHIHAGRVSGAAQFSTDGGNIMVERTGGTVTAETQGGSIEFGEAGGAIHARTSGGGIRIARLCGPTELGSGAGSIFLTGVEAPLHVSTAAGTITAWMSPAAQSGATARGPQRPAEASELSSGQGDIVIYLPREIAVTIDAVIEDGANHSVIADPALPLKVNYLESANGAVRAQAELNGGGKVLRVRAASGNIRLKYLDPATERTLAAAQMQALEQRVVAQRTLLSQMQTPVEGAPASPVAAKAEPARAEASSAAPESTGRFADVARLFESLWGSGMRVEPDEQQKRLVRPVVPEYPEVARQAGIEGNVTLRVLIGKDGAVEQVTPLAGEQILLQSAVNAVEQWRYAPMLLDGRPVSVLTTVTVSFRLQ